MRTPNSASRGDTTELSFFSRTGSCSRICGISRWSTAISSSTSITQITVSSRIISVTPIARGTRRRCSQSTPGFRI
ncbi:hypothetical protein D9M68_816960 [compost metagenome]